MNMKKYKMYNSRKRKFNALSGVLVALLLAVVILLNVAVYALGSHFRWYIDMSEGQVFSLCDATKDLLRDTDDEINIYFAVEADRIASESPYLFYVYQTALEMQKTFDFVNVECIDIIKNPGFYKDYYTTAAQDIKTTSVVVTGGSEFRLFSIESFFITNEDGNIWAYQGEYRLVSAILSMTAAEMPTVCFTTSHGETVGEKASALVNLFSSAGYNVANVDLTAEELPDDTRIVIINDPVYDFAGIETGEEGANEIDKLDSFLDDYGCLMVFAAPERAAKLTNLSEFLAEWGIAFVPDTYIRDTKNSVSIDNRSIVASYEDEGLGSSLYLDIAKLDDMPKTILKNAMPLQILWERNDALDGVRDCTPVLSTHESAVAVKNGEETEAADIPLMALSRETRVRDNEYYYSYVLVCGSAEYNNSEYLLANAYANSDILYNTMRITGRERIIADIEYKVLDDTSLDITTAQANNWTVAIVTVIPAIVAVCGVAVWVRRKNS